jgi:hypothetical protein
MAFSTAIGFLRTAHDAPSAAPRLCVIELKPPAALSVRERTDAGPILP